MNVRQIAERLAACDCGNVHYEPSIEEIRIESGALAAAANFAALKSLRRVTLVCDERTYEAAGRELETLLRTCGADIHTVKLLPNANGDVLADEVSIVQALLETPNDTEAVYAVGAGTIHDIARFVSFKMSLPFVSVPTAASVDGFNSMGAPLIVRGFKSTFQLHSPLAVFADLDILAGAPREMAAAGVGDMIAKYTSLLDWEFSRIAAGEPYCRTAAELTREALNECVGRLGDIAGGSKEGLAALMRGLILSGLAMLGFGQSHPASGGEHHVSHVWEMEVLQRGKKQLLHGAKVGVSSRLVAERYKSEFAPLLAGAAELPEAVAREMLGQAGGQAEPSELGIDGASVDEALRMAHTIRNRYTILRFLNERRES